MNDPYKDLSHVYANPLGDDAGQDEFSKLPDDVVDHIIAAFVHKAGLGPNPGKLKRPARKAKKITP